MFLQAALRLINHLLASETWAQDRLRAFAGQSLRLELGSLALPLEVAATGLFAKGTAETATVTIRLPADAPLRALSDRSSFFSAAHISGSAELAESIGFIFKNLRWDAEGDLARLIGDIAAHRLVGAGQHFFRQQRRKAGSLALNAAEFFTEERPSIAHQADVSAFCADVGQAAQAMHRLEQRITALEAALPVTA